MALVGYEHELAAINQKIATLRRSAGRRPPVAESLSEDGTAPRKKRSRMSAAGRKRVAEAQRRRWAALKKAAKAQ
jgi:hypothetical protein